MNPDPDQNIAIAISELKEHPTPNRRPKQASADSVSNTSLVRFACGDCEDVFLLPEDSFAYQPYKSNCQHCDRPISIRLVHDRDGLDVVELDGCIHVGDQLDSLDLSDNTLDKLFDSLKSQTQKPVAKVEEPAPQKNLEKTRIDPDPLAAYDDMLRNLLEEWTVNKNDGRVLVFESLDSLRRAIRAKEVVRGEIISPGNGPAVAAEKYPGTADLFGNSALAAQARNFMGERSLPKNTPTFKGLLHWTIRAAIMSLVAATLAVAFYYFPKAYHLFRARQGHQLLENLLNRPSGLPAGASGYLAALTANPQDDVALLQLVETFADTSLRTLASTDVAKTRKLLAYAVGQNLERPEILRIRGKLLWASQKPQEALKLLSQNLIQYPQDAESHYLMANIALSTGDFVQTTLHVNEALQLEPNNLQYLSLLVDGLEKQNKYSEAAAYLSQLERVSENQGPILRRMALLYRKAGDTDSAKSVYARAIGGGYELEQNRFGLIKVLKDDGQFQELVNQALIYFDQHRESSNYGAVLSLYDQALAQIAPAQEDTGAKKSKRKRSRRRRRFRR